MLQRNQTLKQLWINANNLSDKGIEILFPYLIGNQTLRTLNISNNKNITAASYPFVKSIYEKSRIENIEVTWGLHLSQNDLFCFRIINKLRNGWSQLYLSERFEIVFFNNLIYILIFFCLFDESIVAWSQTTLSSEFALRTEECYFKI